MRCIYSQKTLTFGNNNRVNGIITLSLPSSTSAELLKNKSTATILAVKTISSAHIAKGRPGLDHRKVHS